MLPFLGKNYPSLAPPIIPPSFSLPQSKTAPEGTVSMSFAIGAGRSLPCGGALAIIPIIARGWSISVALRRSVVARTIPVAWGRSVALGWAIGIPLMLAIS
jgi:hypothetical protein